MMIRRYAKPKLGQQLAEKRRSPRRVVRPDQHHTNGANMLVVLLLSAMTFFVALGDRIDTHLGVTEVAGTRTSGPVQNQRTSASPAANRDIGEVPAKAIPQVVLPSNGKGEK